MKTALFSLALLVAVASAEQKGIADAKIQVVLITAAKDCVKENGYPADYVNLASRAFIPIEKDEMCFYECFFSKLNIVKEGKFYKEVLRALKERTVDKESAVYFDSAVNRCDVTDFKNCRPGYELQRCLFDFHTRFQALDDSTRINA